jgi:hypothetical protein
VRRWGESKKNGSAAGWYVNHKQRCRWSNPNSYGQIKPSMHSGLPHRVVSDVPILLEEALDRILLALHVAGGHPAGVARRQLACHAACNRVSHAHGAVQSAGATISSSNRYSTAHPAQHNTAQYSTAQHTC